jgi:hypothetical protein
MLQQASLAGRPPRANTLRAPSAPRSKSGRPNILRVLATRTRRPNHYRFSAETYSYGPVRPFAGVVHHQLRTTTQRTMISFATAVRPTKRLGSCARSERSDRSANGKFYVTTKGTSDHRGCESRTRDTRLGDEDVVEWRVNSARRRTITHVSYGWRVNPPDSRAASRCIPLARQKHRVRAKCSCHHRNLNGISRNTRTAHSHSVPRYVN